MWPLSFTFGFLGLGIPSSLHRRIQDEKRWVYAKRSLNYLRFRTLSKRGWVSHFPFTLRLREEALG